MNWDAIGTIAEIIGAVAVIISLIYLAIQVRNNTRQEVFQSFQAVAQSYLKSIDRVTATKEDAEIFRQGLNRFGDLPANDQGAFHSKMHSLLHGFHGVWISYKAGMLPEYELVAMRRILLELLMTPGGRQWWESFKHIPPPHVIAYLEEEAEKLEGEIMSAIDAYPWLRREE